MTVTSAFSDPLSDRALKVHLERRRKSVDRALAGCLPGAGDCPPRLRAAMAYSLTAGGKRLRPILSLAAAEACGGDWRRVMPAACALELVHTYSLIHDDLPAMDDDDFRRGRPTSHKVFGEALAILAGDALLTRAFEVLAAARLPAESRVSLVGELAAAAGPEGMVGGQVVDMETEGTAADRETVLGMHRRKTGALITASVRMGAIAAAASDRELARLTDYGRGLGAAFQAVDDLLDLEGDLARLGKTPGSDERRGKATLPAAVGVEGARREAERLAESARRAVTPLGARGRVLAALVDYVLARKE